MSIQDAWTRLTKVRRLFFESRLHAIPSTGWNGQGQGTVAVEQPDSRTTIFHEQGNWTPEIGRPGPFSNVFRWTLDPENCHIRLEHLRLGAKNPVYLFDLVTTHEQTLVSSEPHVCSEDLYTAIMELDPQVIRLRWTITGPQKNENIQYEYR